MRYNYDINPETSIAFRMHKVLKEYLDKHTYTAEWFIDK